MSFDGDLLINGNGGDGVGTGVPEAAPVHDAVVAEERATARDWAVVGNRDVGCADALRDAAVLAPRNLSEEHPKQHEGQTSHLSRLTFLAAAKENHERRPLEEERDVGRHGEEG